jgi:hypothetical protein
MARRAAVSASWFALGLAATVFVDGVLGGRPVHAGGVVIGVAHAGGGQLGQGGLEGGAGFGGQQGAQLRHAVGLLVAQGQPAAARAVVVGVDAVGVDAVGQRRGEFGQLFGPVLGTLGGQQDLHLFAGGVVDPAG